MIRVGLTGGIGSGKSTVGALLRAHGAVVVDHDALARHVVEPGEPAFDEIVERFGTGILAPDGTLNRPALAAVVFADQTALRDLEAITHPAVRQAARQLEADAGPDAIVVHDIPLLTETGVVEDYDSVLVVDVPESVQIERLMRDRRMTEAEARARIDAQATREQRLAVADHVIENSGTREELVRAVDHVWRRLMDIDHRRP